MKYVQDILIMFLLHTVYCMEIVKGKLQFGWIQYIVLTLKHTIFTIAQLSMLIIAYSKFVPLLPIELLPERAKLTNYCPVSPISLVVTASNFIRDCMSFLLIKFCLEKLCFQNVAMHSDAGRQGYTSFNNLRLFKAHGLHLLNEMISSIC